MDVADKTVTSRTKGSENSGNALDAIVSNLSAKEAWPDKIKSVWKDGADESKRKLIILDKEAHKKIADLKTESSAAIKAPDAVSTNAAEWTNEQKKQAREYLDTIKASETAHSAYMTAIREIKKIEKSSDKWTAKAAEVTKLEQAWNDAKSKSNVKEKALGAAADILTGMDVGRTAGREAAMKLLETAVTATPIPEATPPVIPEGAVMVESGDAYIDRESDAVTEAEEKAAIAKFIADAPYPPHSEREQEKYDAIPDTTTASLSESLGTLKEEMETLARQLQMREGTFTVGELRSKRELLSSKKGIAESMQKEINERREETDKKIERIEPIPQDNATVKLLNFGLQGNDVLIPSLELTNESLQNSANEYQRLFDQRFTNPNYNTELDTVKNHIAELKWRKDAIGAELKKREQAAATNAATPDVSPPDSNQTDEFLRKTSNPEDVESLYKALPEGAVLLDGGDLYIDRVQDALDAVENIPPKPEGDGESELQNISLRNNDVLIPSLELTRDTLSRFSKSLQAAKDRGDAKEVAIITSNIAELKWKQNAIAAEIKG